MHLQFTPRGVKGHPQDVMEKMGIKYSHCTPQSMFDCWMFWNCKNVPKNIPSFLKVREWDPMKYIGNGLSEETANEIKEISEKEESK